MSDFLLELARNPTAKKLIRNAGLPIPMPTALSRCHGPLSEHVLADRDVVVGGEGTLSEVLAQSVVVAGANPWVVGDKLAKAFASPGEAYGRNAQLLAVDEMPEELKADALVFDGTSLEGPADLRRLYDFFQPRIRSLKRCGRVLVLVRPTRTAKTAASAAAFAAAEGFVRSVGKEIGKHGATANLLYVEEGAEGRLDGPLRFFLSDASAFVTLQPLTVSSTLNGAKNGKSDSHVRTLSGKVALVTGAARGIGAATAEILAGEGAHVVCLDRPADDGPTSQVARKIGGTVLLVDVSAPDAPAQIARTLKDRHGGVDIVVHNAGVTRDKMLANMKSELWDQAVDINLGAIVRINDAIVERGVLRDGGRLIGLSSIAGLSGNAGQTNYAASKSGLAGYVVRLSTELAGRGISVNAVAPGFIETRLTEAMPVALREVARRLSALGQGGQPEDVARGIAFLSLPSSAGITGQVLRTCGGAFVGA